jgi:hypothetical protein
MRSLPIIAITLLCGCSDFGELFTKPRPYGLGQTPEGSPIFKQGWEDGCDTGLGVNGGLSYRRKSYRFKQDITMLDNPEYYGAWKTAYTYCRFYVWNWSRPWHGNTTYTVFD